MDIERHCPFVADAFLWQPALGEHRLTVCVKATFALIHGRNADIAAHQIALHEDLPWEAQNPSSLYASSDYVPKKQRIDILLTGHAYAPAGNPTTSLTARLQVGTFTKSLRITGDRTWTPTREGPRPSSARPFVSMPLRYERAALGPANPIGIDASQGAALAGRPLPNIQLVDEKSAQQGVPGFGPVPAAVRARRLRMNENLIKWAKLFRSEATPPSIDFDFAFFNAAPPDQQLDTLPEPLDIVLENLHPSIARFSSRIPSIGLRAFRVSPKTGLSYALPLLLDTVLIDSDRSLAILSFRSNTAVNTADERALGKLVITAAEAPQASADMVFAGRDSSPPPLSRPAEANAAPPPQATPPPAAKRDGGTVPLPSALSAQAPPRARGGVGETTITTRENPIDFLKNSNALPKSWTAPLPPSPLNPSASVNIGSLPPSSLVKKPDRDEPGSSTLDSSINSIGFNRALPFVSSTPNPPAPAYPAAPSNHRARSADPDEIGSTTLAAPAATAPGSSILPFGKPLSAAAAPPIESNARASSPPPLRPPEISGTLPLGMRSPTQLSSGLPFQTRGETPPKPPVFNAPPPEPPPFIPPPRSSQPGLSPPPPAVFPPPPRSSQPGLSPPPPAVLPPPMSIEQCASVAAELGARLSPRTEVLRKYQLDEAVFGEAERHWMNAIASESEAGKSDLLELFDERYVQALEKLRGEITLEMYAQLMVGSERGNLRPALAELKLQRPAVLRIERVWKRRISRDAKLAAMAADAIALERKK